MRPRTLLFLAACAVLLAGFCVALYATSPGATAAGFAMIACAFGVMTASAPRDAAPPPDPTLYVLRADVRALCLRQGREYGGPLHPTALALSIVGNLVVDGLELPPEQRADDGVELGF